MPLETGAQRRWKEVSVRDSLHRIGGVDPAAVEPIRGGGLSLGYRSRVEFSIGRDAGGRVVVGMHGHEPSAGLVDVEACLLETPLANRILATAREFLLSPGRTWPALDPVEPFRLLLRQSATSGAVVLALRETSAEFPEAEALADAVTARHDEVVGVVRLRARAGRRGGVDARVISGVGWLAERIGGIEFRVPATCFTQVNHEWVEQLPALVRELVGENAGPRAVDLYGGIGVHAFALAAGGAERVTVCEADADAIACGEEAARRAGIAGVSFVRSSAERFVERGWPRGGAVDVVVANPPRTGLAGPVAHALGRHAASRIVLVSCDPPTLGRDVGILGRAGYRLRRAVPVDLFPQTPHVEVVALLER
jgi:23S rRNA (uracil1939-C5)-methyltransferase